MLIPCPRMGRFLKRLLMMEYRALQLAAGQESAVWRVCYMLPLPWDPQGPLRPLLGPLGPICGSLSPARTNAANPITCRRFRRPAIQAHYRGAGDSRCVIVFKPHGCVRSLDQARAALDDSDVEGARLHAGRFLITAD